MKCNEKKQNGKENLTKMSALWLIAVFGIFTIAFASEDAVDVSTGTAVEEAELTLFEYDVAARCQSLSLKAHLRIPKDSRPQGE